MCMRASGASELRKFGIFTFLNCYFFQYFVGTNGYIVGTNYMLVGLPTNFQMYRQNSEKALLGVGSCPPPPPPPPLATLMSRSDCMLGMVEFDVVFIIYYLVINFLIAIYISRLHSYDIFKDLS